ncbi:MAG TPA: hypothetical protein VK012_00120 [Gemmatimonadales bacterium]|nr:hypothetical protein [Gemmatimonadales bacterium]
MLHPILRALAFAAVPAVLHASVAAAQVAPTLPSDTLQGRKLPPEANVPRQVIAPTLPSDTLFGSTDPCDPPARPQVVASTPRPPGVLPDTARDVARPAAGDSAAAAGPCQVVFPALPPEPGAGDSMPADSMPADSILKEEPDDQR